MTEDGRSMNCDADVVVVGAGPAGTAAAIWSALSRLRVTLIECSRFPRHRPGETLHPGAECLLRQLGVLDRVSAACTVRHRAVSVDWAGRKAEQSFGEDSAGPWYGYQILREELDRILIQRAAEAGVQVLQPCLVDKPVIRDGRVCGIRHGGCLTSARLVIDATGSANWLRRRLRLHQMTASPPMTASYGYCEGELSGATANPSLCGDANGWIWTAMVGARLFQWTRLSFHENLAPTPPHSFSALRAQGKTRYSDVTWRCLEEPAGPGYLIAGDAAMVLDPATSHGVLRALMSGMMASHSAQQILAKQIDEWQAYVAYQNWLRTWFAHDVERLSALYRQLDPQWPFFQASGAQP